jgi:hypothetical protein
MKRQRRINGTLWVLQPEKFFSARSTHFGLGQLLLTWLFASLLASLAYAVPMTTTYQGYLENADGEPLNDTVDMTFALYDTAQGGDALWSEIHQQVEVTNGVFSLILGNTTQFDDNSLAGDRYLGVTVGNDPEMTPRQPITSAFFVMRAEVANSVKAATVTTEAIVEGAVTADKIAAQTITGDKIANLSGHSVTELDDVTDAGSGKIITDAERQKLAGLSGGTGSSSTFDELHVKKHLKVGESSIHLDSSGGAAPKNEIYTTDGPLVIQKNSNAPPQNVGIGTESPKGKLDVAGTLKVVQGNVNVEAYKEKGLFFNYFSDWGDVAVLKNNNFPIEKLGFTGLEVSGDPLVLNAYTDPNRPDKIYFEGTGHVGVGTKTPKNTLDVLGSATIGSGYAGKETAPKNGLIVEGNVGIGTNNPQAKLHVNGGLRAKKGDTNGDGSNVGYAFDGDGDTGIFAVGGEFVQNSDLFFKVDNDTKLVVRDNGNIGIGTTTPNCKLDVHGDTCLGSNDKLQIGPWKFWQDGGGNVTSNLYIGRTTDTLVRIDWFGTVRAHAFIPPSDARWKKDVEPLENTLDKVSKLRGVSYRWNTEEYPDINFDGKPQIGFIAQEVEPVLPELVSTDENGYKGLDYDKMTAVLVEAVKELKAQNDALKAIVCKDHPEEAICQ